MPVCHRCGKFFKKTGKGRCTEKLCPRCWLKRGTPKKKNENLK